MRLTAERKRVLRALVEYVHLSTAQCYQLLGAETHAAQRSLRRTLRDFASLGFLRRARVILDQDAEDRLPHWEFLYWLSPLGLRLTEAEGFDPHGIGKAAEEKSPLMLAHEHEITAFHLALDAALGAPAWWRQKDLKHAFGTGRERHAVNPDALFFAGRFYHFLEVEKTKLGRYRDGESGLLRKCRAYFAYADPASRPYRAKWPEMEGFFVCVTVATEARRRNFLEALRQHCPYSLFLVATEEAYRADILGRIWRTPRGEERSLLD